MVNEVHLPGTPKLRREKDGIVQAFYVGDELDAPALGPMIGVPGPVSDRIEDQIEVIDPFRFGPSIDPLGAILLGLLALYNALQTEPESLGVTEIATPAMAMRAWKVGEKPVVGPVSLNALGVEEVRQFCKRLIDVQNWTDEAARVFEPERARLGPASFGTKVHTWVKRRIDSLGASGTDHDDLRAELSIADEEEVPYGTKGSTRLDVLEDTRNEVGYVCVYDLKTGDSQLTIRRVQKIGGDVLKHFGPSMFIIVEVKPNP